MDICLSSVYKELNDDNSRFLSYLDSVDYLV